MHEVSLPRAFDLKLLKNILKALQKLVSISLQSLKIDLFYQNILSETLKTGWLTPSDSDRTACLPTLGTQSLWTTPPSCWGVQLSLASPDGSRTVSRGGGKACQKPWEATSITSPWREWTFIESLPQARPLPGVFACWIYAIFTTVLWGLSILPIRKRRFRGICDLLKVIE